MSSHAARTQKENTLVERYRMVRDQTDALAQPLSAEDACVQSMADTSPAKWHLAHTTWFFETFVLEPQIHRHVPFDANYRFLFNSYYNTVGEQYSRAHRGLLSRPELSKIKHYRQHVDAQMIEFIGSDCDAAVTSVIEVGLHHEQQHQELLLMDIKHLFSRNPIFPTYRPSNFQPGQSAPLKYHEFEGGIVPLGAVSSAFSFDNERPRHDTLVRDFKLGSRLVTNQDFLEFILDGGYSSPLLWLADGWSAIQHSAWTAPLYWREIDDERCEFTLSGMQQLCLAAPVVHLSYYEADAYARWAGARLPTETEWETAASSALLDGNFLDDGLLHPRPLTAESLASPAQLFGDVWEWTMSPYTPYPGFQIPAGAIGEYNGKFMSGQMVLRGGACVTPADHIRSTYRNFFYPNNRWQFGGIRLARD